MGAYLPITSNVIDMRTSTHLSLLLERLLERERRLERLGERPLSLREGLPILLGLLLLGLL